MDQRTRQCVRRMKLKDIANLPEPAYQRALMAFTEDEATLNSIYGLRLNLIQDGLHPGGWRWKEVK